LQSEGKQVNKAREGIGKDLIRKKGLEAGEFNVPYLLAMKANTQLGVDIGENAVFL
jgi:hypothetical protein